MTFDLQIIGERYSSCDGALCIEPSADQCALSFYRSPSTLISRDLYSNCTFDGSRTYWAAKFNFEYCKTFENCNFIGGSKGLVDICRGGDITFKNCSFISNKGSTPVLIKGGAKNIKFDRCDFSSNNYHPFGFWFYVGMWSLLDLVMRPCVRNVEILNCNFIKGPFFLSTIAFSEKIKIHGCKKWSLNVPRWIVKAYWRFKKWLCGRRGVQVPAAMQRIYPQEL